MIGSLNVKNEKIILPQKSRQFLKANAAYKAEIQGYTDLKGSAKYNQKLSERRAKQYMRH